MVAKFIYTTSIEISIFRYVLNVNK